MRLVLLIAVMAGVVATVPGCRRAKAKPDTSTQPAARVGQTVILRWPGRAQVPVFQDRGELDEFVGKVRKGSDPDYFLARLGGKKFLVESGTRAVVSDISLGRYLLEFADREGVQAKGWVDGEWVQTDTSAQTGGS